MVDRDISNRLKDYLDGPFTKINGWCNPYIFQALQPIADFQKSVGLTAPIAEIGVFQGKFFIALVKAVGASGKHHAFDVFDMQEFNLDFAGAGNLKAFKNNIKLAGEDPDKMELVQKDSTTFRQSDLVKLWDEVGGFSIFSVDGCHMAEHTINDIRVAMALTSDAGVIFVDDYYNPSWPGVQEGVCKLYLSECPTFVPLAYTANKLMLCHIGYHSRYLAFMQKYVEANFPQTKLKRVSRFGYDSLTFLPEPKSTKYVA